MTIHITLQGTAKNLPDVLKALAGFQVIEAHTTYSKDRIEQDPAKKASRAVDILRRRAHGLDTPPPIG